MSSLEYAHKTVTFTKEQKESLLNIFGNFLILDDPTALCKNPEGPCVICGNIKKRARVAQDKIRCLPEGM